MYKTGKIVVIGQSDVKPEVLLSIAKQLGLDKKRFELYLEYEDAKKFNFQKIQWQPTYSLLMVGPMPHSGSGKGDYMLSQKYQLEQIELDEKIQKLKAALAEGKQSVEDARKWIEIVKQYSEPTELTAELLNNMIDKIVVHEAIKYENGFREQKIEIYYRFVGKID